MSSPLGNAGFAGNNGTNPRSESSLSILSFLVNSNLMLPRAPQACRGGRGRCSCGRRPRQFPRGKSSFRTFRAGIPQDTTPSHNRYQGIVWVQDPRPDGMSLRFIVPEIILSRLQSTLDRVMSLPIGMTSAPVPSLVHQRQ